MREYFEGRTLYGIYDLVKEEWTLDCFDDTRVFFSAESAESYRTACKDYNSTRYEARIWKPGTLNEAQEKLKPNC